MPPAYSSKTHISYSPNKVVLGVDSAARTAVEVRQLGGSRVLLVTDPGVIQAGLTRTVEASFQTEGIPYVLYDQVEPEPPSRIIDQGARIFKSEDCDLVVGIGGGSSLDVAKGISILAANAGCILDYIGMDLVSKKGAPMILLPTTAGTGSEVTRVLVMTDEQQNTKNVVFTPFALADTAIIDPRLTLSMPPLVTADTGMDALVHAVETYVSMNATEFSDVWAEKAIALIGRYLPVAWAKGSNLEARYYMSLGAALAGMAFTSGGLGAVHALAYPLGTEYHMTHGRTNAIMLPHVMRYNLSGSPEKYAVIAALLGQEIEGLSPMEAASLAVEAVLELQASIDVSCRMRDYDIPETDLSRLTEGAMRQSRLFIPNPRDLTENNVLAIYQEAF